jgi:hypothetical protein
MMSEPQFTMPAPKAFQICPACSQQVNLTEYSCPNCGKVFWNPLSGLGCGAVFCFVLLGVISNFAFASGSSFWIIVAILFDLLFGFTGIMMMVTFFKALLKIYRPNLTPKIAKETVPSALDMELFTACEKGDSEKVKVLIENHVNVNMVSGDYSCLLTAVANGNFEIVKSLVAAGANLNWKNRLNDTPLKIAAMLNHQEIVDYLKSEGAIYTGVEKTMQDNINEVLLAENQELLSGDIWVNISLTGADAMQSVRLHNLKGGKKLCFSLVAADDRIGKTELIVQDTSGKSYSLNDITEPVLLYISKDTLPFLKQDASIWDRVKNKTGL